MPTDRLSKMYRLERPSTVVKQCKGIPAGDRGVEAHTAGNNRGRGRVGAAMQKADIIHLNHERQSCL